MSDSFLSTSIEIITVIVEVYTFIIYLKAFLQPHSIQKAYKTIIYAVAILTLSTISIIGTNALLLAAVNCIMMLMISTVYEGSWGNKFLYVVLFVAFTALIDYLVFFMLTFLKGLTFTRDYPLERVLGIVITKIISYALVRILYLRKKQKNEKLPLSSYILFSVLPISSVIVMFELLIFKDVEVSIASTIFILLGIVLLFFSNFAVFILFEQQMVAQIEREQLRMLEQQIEQQKEYYKDLTKRQKEIRQIQHDMKNYITSLSGYLEKGNINQALKFINGLDYETSSSKQLVETGYPAFDTILWEKIRLAEHSQIEIKYHVIMPVNLYINEMDLCILLANALDNAIEACQKINETNRRKIELAIKSEDSFISIYIKNSVDKKIVINHNDILKTTKHDKKFHGFGLQSIKKFSNKYRGDLVLKCDDEYFILSVLLQNIAILT